MAKSIKKFIIKDAHGGAKESGSFSVVGEVHVDIVPGYGVPYAESEYVNGILTITIHNIEGNGVTDITTDSQEGDEAVNTVTIKTEANPEGVTMEVRNGSKGEKGDKGDKGDQGDSAVYDPSSPDTPDFVMANTTGQSTTKAMTQKAVTDGLIGIVSSNRVTTVEYDVLARTTNSTLLNKELEVGKTYIFELEVEETAENDIHVYLYNNESRTNNIYVGVLPQGGGGVKLVYVPQAETNYQYVGFFSDASQHVTFSYREKLDVAEIVETLRDKSLSEVYTKTYNVESRTQYRYLFVPKLIVGETYVFNVKLQEIATDLFSVILYSSASTSVNTYKYIGQFRDMDEYEFEYTPQEESNYQYLGFWTNVANQATVTYRKKVIGDTIKEIKEISESCNAVVGKYILGQSIGNSDIVWSQGSIDASGIDISRQNAIRTGFIAVSGDFSVKNESSYNLTLVLYQPDGTYLKQIGIRGKGYRTVRISDYTNDDAISTRVVLWANAGTSVTPSDGYNSVWGIRVLPYSTFGISDMEEIELPMPSSLARVNLDVSVLPTQKGSPVLGYIEYRHNDVYFRKAVEIDCQGASSMTYIQKNLAIDFSDGSTIKFGNWVPQDSFHLKCYYIDVLRGYNNIACKYVEDIIRYKDCRANRNMVTVTKDNASGIFDRDFDCALCHPDGFPIELYVNNSYYGLYTWNLKKHRDNYSMKKGDYLQIHLDGEISDSYLFNGVVNWTKFEIRNPKKLILVDGETEYDGDDPHEIIGSDSPNYDDAVKDIKNTAITKSAIIRLSHAKAEVNAAVGLEAKRAKFEEYFDVKMMTVYLVLSNALDNFDGFTKNWQWLCYDGVWSPNFYDMDSLFGRHWTGAYVWREPQTHLGLASSSSLVGTFYSLYEPEIKALWKDLRDKGMISTSYIMEYVYGWVNLIGREAFARNIEKWPQIPSYREDYPGVNYTDGTSNYSVANRGMYDSPSRIRKWLDAHIAFIDTILDYQ